MTGPRRAIIVHCHMFKNAGMTFDWSLRRFFGDRFFHHTDNENMSKGAVYLASFLESHPELCAISSHHVRLPLPIVQWAQLIPAFLIRHPIERAYSVYAFERAQLDDTPGAQMAKKYSFEDYIQWRMEPEAGPALRNFQTRCCIRGVDPGSPAPTRDELTDARRTLEDSPLVGVVDLYDESMTVFEGALESYFPGIDLAHVPQNTGTYRDDDGAGSNCRREPPHREADAEPLALDVADPETSLRALRVLRALSGETGALLIENNALDLELYRIATLMVLERFKQLDDAEDRLAGFRRRCRALVKRSAANPA